MCSLSHLFCVRVFIYIFAWDRFVVPQLPGICAFALIPYSATKLVYESFTILFRHATHCSLGVSTIDIISCPYGMPSSFFLAFSAFSFAFGFMFMCVFCFVFCFVLFSSQRLGAASFSEVHPHCITAPLVSCARRCTVSPNDVTCSCHLLAC